MRVSVEALLPRLRGVRKSGEGWLAQCPCHDDSSPSLSVREGRSGRALVKCHGCGAGYRDVLAALPAPPGAAPPPTDPTPSSPNASGGGLTLRRYAELKGLDPGFLEGLGLSTDRGRVRIPYRDSQGGVRAVRFRAAGGFSWERGAKPCLYGLDRLAEVPEGATVWLVEGESDAQTLWAHGLHAVGVPGASTFRPEWSAELDRAGRVLLWREPDEGGARLEALVAASPLAGKTRVAAVPGFKDASELFLAAPGRFLGRMAQAERESRPLEAAPKPEQPEGAEARERRSAVAQVLRERLCTRREVGERTFDEPPYLVEGLVPTGGVTLLVAKPKVGKSTFLRTLLASVATGRPFLGREVVAGPVVYLAFEESAAQTQRILAEMGVPEDAPMHFAFGPLPLEGSDAQLVVEEAVRATGAALVAVDPVFRLIKPPNGDDYAAMSTALEPMLETARRLGVALVLSHHARKRQGEDEGDSPLGSTAMFAVGDATIFLKKQGGGRQINSVMRYADDLEATALRLVEGGWLELGEAEAPKREEAVEASVRGFLAETPGAAHSEVTKAVGGRPGPVAKALKAMAERGELLVEGKGKARSPRRYRLAPAGDLPKALPEEA